MNLSFIRLTGGLLVLTAFYHDFLSIFRIETQTGDVSLLTPSFPFSQNPVWPPDGNYILYAMRDNGNKDQLFVGRSMAAIIIRLRLAERQKSRSPGGHEVVSVLNRLILTGIMIIQLWL